jgi:hypothetical protein
MEPVISTIWNNVWFNDTDAQNKKNDDDAITLWNEKKAYIVIYEHIFLHT